MHLADGVLSPAVLAGGTLLAAGGVALGLRGISQAEIPKVAVLAAAFFVASLIHVPVGPGQVHLVLNGLAGLLLGWAVFPALLVALLLQAILFGYGGITVLGVNTLNMALPGVACYYLFLLLQGRRPGLRLTPLVGFLAGVGGIGLGGAMLAGSLFLSDSRYAGAAGLILVAHLPLMLIEGVLTGAALVFLGKVCPAILPTRHLFREDQR